MEPYAKEYHTVSFANFYVPLIHHILSCISFSSIFSGLLKKKRLIYITHPQYDSHQFNGVLNVNSEMIAEDIILEYLEQGMSLEIYGFNSTLQYNLNNISTIKNYKITRPFLKDSFNHGLGFDFNQVSV
ncbi:glycosyltransferase family 52 [Salmonella enterica subsp. enterica serovar Larochelle]|uniref:glycosyltransferase family 52 n=1 Tax=Salmonella enterica TaxID=28901 RepID=UPI003315B0DC|nr:glycosyltransferase family 52 [Salmonella enterica]MDJ6615906.1 glycosyltransferase family 52 [Salmonella enterica]